MAMPCLFCRSYVPTLDTPMKGFNMSTDSAAPKTPTGFDPFSVLGRLVVRAPWLMIAAWIAVVGVLTVAFPPLTKVVEGQTLQPLPPKAVAAAEQMAKDFGESAHNILIVVLTDERGLQPADEDVYRKLATTLRGETNDVSGVQDIAATPALRSVRVSPDNKAFYLAVNLRAPVGSPQSSQAYQRITEIAKRSTASSALTADVTGQAAIVGADHPAGDLPPSRDRATAIDHHRHFGDGGPGRGVRVDPARTPGVRANDRVDDGNDRGRRHRLRRLLDQPLPRVHP